MPLPYPHPPGPHLCAASRRGCGGQTVSLGSVGGRSAGVQHVVGVDDPVGVALLGEEPLPVGGEVGVDGVAGDDRVEVRGAPVALGPQHPAEALGLLLAGAERAGHLDRDARLGQVDREVRDLADHEQPDLAGAERLVQLLPLGDRRLAGDQVGVEPLGERRRAGRGTGR